MSCRFSCRPAVAGLIGAAVFAAVSILAAVCAAETPRRDSPTPADRLVTEALRQEVRGTEDRQELLQQALEQAPGNAAARWHTGHVRIQKAWVHIDEVPERVADSKFLSAYYELRDNCLPTADGQRRLAAWCGRHGLKDQERAHLTRLLDLDPNDAEARRKLGFVNRDGVWMSDEEAKEADQRDQRQDRSLAQWRGKLEGIRRRLDEPAQGRKAVFQRREAMQEWERIDDPSSIPAMEVVFNVSSNRTGALRVVDKLAAMKSHEASEALARYAVLSNFPEVQQRAVDALKTRPLPEYVPLLLSSMYTSTQARSELYQAPSGRIVARQVLTREGQDRREELVIEQPVRGGSLPSGNPAFRTPFSPTGASTTLGGGRVVTSTPNAPALAGLQTDSMNVRICDVLTQTTGESLGSSPENWWRWWNQYNEVFVPGAKPVQRAVVRGLPVPTVPRLAPRPSGLANVTSGMPNLSSQLTSIPQPGPYDMPPPSRMECLVAGTPIWTERGPIAVEQVQVGDRVLAQDPESGELAYKPVLRTTVRPPSPLLKIDLEDETITASGGHQFWIAGVGWVRARELQPGTRLHGATAPREVCAVSEAEGETTYNLIVADFHSYFAGRGRVLSHDNTIVKSTDAIVPGLLKR